MDTCEHITHRPTVSDLKLIQLDPQLISS